MYSKWLITSTSHTLNACTVFVSSISASPSRSINWERGRHDDDDDDAMSQCLLNNGNQSIIWSVRGHTGIIFIREEKTLLIITPSISSFASLFFEIVINLFARTLSTWLPWTEHVSSFVVESMRINAFVKGALELLVGNASNKSWKWRMIHSDGKLSERDTNGHSPHKRNASNKKEFLSEADDTRWLCEIRGNRFFNCRYLVLVRFARDKHVNVMQLQNTSASFSCRHSMPDTGKCSHAPRRHSFIYMFQLKW